MTIPTVAVTVRVRDTDGTALVGATVKAKITAYDTYSSQIVERVEESATTDASGVATLNLFPNTLGERLDGNNAHTAYVFKIIHPTTGRKIYQTTARVPNNACELTDIAGNVDTQIYPAPAATDTGIIVKTAASVYTSRAITVSGAGLSVTNGDGVAGNMVIAVADDLAAIEALTSAGFSARTGTSTWAIRTLQPPAAGLTITNPAGTAGDPTFGLANDLAAIEGLASTGIAVRSGTDTWVQRSITAPAAGITVSNPAGVAGNPTLALANDLAALEALGTAGIGVRTAADTWAIRSLVAPAAGITITNPAGTAGDFTFVLANDLAAVEGLASTGIAVRTGSDAWAQRQLAAPASGITVTNPAGVAGDMTLVLANDLAALEGLGSTGIAVRTGSDAWAQRSIATSTGLSVTNGSGAAGNPTLALDGNALTEDTTPDIDADFAIVYDTSAGTHKKVKLANYLKSKVISFARATAAGTGSVSYTGVGFKPRALFGFGNQGGSVNVGFNGHCDSALSQNCIYDGGGFQAAGGVFLFVGVAGAGQQFVVTSLDADGFTGTWTKVGAGGGADYFLSVLCIG